MLPKLTPLQFLILYFLSVRPLTGRQLRESLQTLGVLKTNSAFSQLMLRLIGANYVTQETTNRAGPHHTVLENRYNITDWGLRDWIETQKYYENFPPPSPDLKPVATDYGRLAAYDDKNRRNVVEKKFADMFQERLMAIIKLG
jgi:hypothetical protein